MKSKYKIIFAILIIAVVTASFGLGYYFAKTEKIEKAEKETPTLEQIYPPSGTVVGKNESTITISGTTNGELVKVNGQVVPIANKMFTATVNLNEGINNIVVEAFLKGNVHKLTVVIIRGTLTVGPTIEIKSPVSGTYVDISETSIEVNGTTDAETLKVNEKIVEIKNKWFTTSVNLTEGLNYIVIEGTKGGNINRITITVIRGIYPLRVMDDFGTVVYVEKNPQRLISLAPSNTEILFALGLGERVVGVDTYSDYPPEAQQKEKVGSYAKINIEKVVALRPDLVFAAFGQKQAVERLQQLNIKVVTYHPKTIRDIFRNIRLTALITGKQATADTLIAKLEHRVKNVTEKTSQLNISAKPRVYYELWDNPYWSAGPGSFVHDLITLAGGINIAGSASTEWPTLTEEFIIASNPQIIITTLMNEATPDMIKNRTKWKDVDAIKNDKVFQVDGNLLERPGPRIVDGLEMLARLFHPALFGAGSYEWEDVFYFMVLEEGQLPRIVQSV